MPCIGCGVEIELKIPQIPCPKCGHFHTVRPDFVHPIMGFTWRFMHHISSLPVYMPTRKPAEMHGIAPSTALRIDKEVLRTQLPPPKLDGIEASLVDEKYPVPSYGFLTLVINARTGEPLHIAKGKDGAALESFFNILSPKQKQSILYLGIDRTNACRAAALKHLSWVKICYDAYHLVSNMNEVVDKVRRVEMQHPTEALRRRLTGNRYNLLRANENLDADAKRELKELPDCNLKLNKTYVLKEQFRTVFSQGAENSALLQLSHRIKMAVVSGVKQAERFAHGIADKFNEVINGIRYSINSGRIEPANAGIKRIRCKCCGLFDIEYLFMKMRQIYISRQYSLCQRI